jgi:hypothetical protein
MLEGLGNVTTYYVDLCELAQERPIPLEHERRRSVARASG